MLSVNKSVSPKFEHPKFKASPFNKTAHLPKKLGSNDNKITSPITETTKVMNQTSKTQKFKKAIPKGSETFLSSKPASTYANQ